MSIDRNGLKPGLVRSTRAAPIATGLGLVALAGLVAIVDPHSATVTPPCPFRLATGLWCPACGLTRSVHHLLHGEVVPSLSDNLFTGIIVATIAVSWWSWMATSLNPQRRALMRLPRVSYYAIAGVAMAYTVIRNVPWFPWFRGGA